VSDRLEAFQRQRALLREHIAWLDREIAALEGTAPPFAPTAPPYAPAAPPPLAAANPLVETEAEAILAEYRQPSVSIQKRAKLGCLIYFLIALAVMAAAVAVLFVMVKRAHGR
jgi:hypothetical protein